MQFVFYILLEGALHYAAKEDGVFVVAVGVGDAVGYVGHRVAVVAVRCVGGDIGYCPFAESLAQRQAHAVLYGYVAVGVDGVEGQVGVGIKVGGLYVVDELALACGKIECVRDACHLHELALLLVVVVACGAVCKRCGVAVVAEVVVVGEIDVIHLVAVPRLF